ncbi:macrophage mannose receptor 1-like [Tachypleus tridentatus]|uniref:macrophage mannose receptor 1-like n=1 Tax=Tachypleus tridentatus TaxID=6853 RepID=UPI003FD26504
MLTPSLSNCLLVRRWYIILSYIFLSSFTVRGQIRDTKTDFVIFEEDSTFEDAILYCKEKGGFLPSISNETDRNRLTEFVKQVNMNDKTFWLGISDRNKERLFESVNGEVVPFLPSFWAAGEPDNGGGTEPTCAKLQKEIDSELYLLKDTACGKYHYGICEIVKGDNGCENMHEDYCYELLEALRRSFSDSDAACQKWYNGRLAKVANLDKLLYFSELILEKGKENEDYWIGLTDGDRKGLWKFMDGNEAPFVPELWFNNEPNNNNRDYQDEDCVVATVTKDKLLFEDRKCSDSYNFICVIKSVCTVSLGRWTTISTLLFVHGS